LEVEISRTHPLIILYGPTATPEVASKWAALPPEIRDCCVLMLDCPSTERAQQLEGFARECARAREYGIPVVIQTVGPDPEYSMHLEDVETLLQRFDNIKGVQICETVYGAFSRFGGDEKYAIPTNSRYATDTIRLVAKYGKFLSWQLQNYHYAFIGSCELNRELYDTMVEYKEYVLPQHEMNQPQGWLMDHDSAMGLWIAGAVENWGIEPQSWFWGDCHYEQPGGHRGNGNRFLMPGEMYGLMLLTGITAGATVYSFEPPDDIWDIEKHWKKVSEPLLLRVIRDGLIPSREEVLGKMKVAYQLQPVKWYPDFLPVVRDLSEWTSTGNLIRGTYGVYRRLWEIEAIPNTGKYYWIPILPAWTGAEVLNRFQRIVRAGEFKTPEEFHALFDQYYTVLEGEGTAWMVNIGKATYVANSHENMQEEQTYGVLLPAPPKALVATATGDGVRLEWQKNGGADRGCFVYRREPGESEFRRLNVEPVREAEYVDSDVPGNQRPEYAVTALTSAREWHSGTVQMHEYHVFSNEESPFSNLAVPGAALIAPEKPQLNLPPPPRQPEAVTEILARIGDFQRALEAEDLDGLMDVYASPPEIVVSLQLPTEGEPAAYKTYALSPGYRDSLGRDWSYVRLAYQWLFRRYDYQGSVIDVYEWDLSQADSAGIVKCRAWTFIVGVSTVEENFMDVVFLPRGETFIEFTWQKVGEKWRIISTDPPLPDFDQLLIYST